MAAKKSKRKSSSKKKINTAKKMASRREKSSKKSSGNKLRTRKAAPEGKKPRRANRVSGTSAFSRQEPGGVQAGDLQGLSRIEEADSESVSELTEEGNALEADAVSGVESADDADEREVHTHEVPEDDIPKEYLEDE